MPLLPHLIDLGKELAHFSTTVVRVVPSPPAHRYGVEEHDNLHGHDRKDIDGCHVVSRNGGRHLGGSADEDEEDEVGREEDILRIMWRACWYVIETIQERVQLSVEMEEQERLRAANGGNGGGGPGSMPPPYSMSKISREGYREGEETYVVYEQYEGHELESFDGFNRGYDSDDESFGLQSGHDLM